uniref:Uncharacterized protein n=1 Tax=Hyaloperonospora arabidopsidis (strain Emoy2) TaxID=559515 RepID=M4B532_HYAAE
MSGPDRNLCNPQSNRNAREALIRCVSGFVRKKRPGNRLVLQSRRRNTTKYSNEMSHFVRKKESTKATLTSSCIPHRPLPFPNYPI